MIFIAPIKNKNSIQPFSESGFKLFRNRFIELNKIFSLGHKNKLL